MESKISIIVPVYNAEKTIDKCIESIIHQTYENIELILVNDGSKDSSLKICSQYASNDMRIHVIDSENKGVSEARNIGLKEASGDYILFCDSDDFVSPYWAETMRSKYEPNMLIMCKLATFDNDETTCNIQIKEFENLIIDKKDFIYYREIGIGSPTNKLFESKIIKKYNIKFSNKLSLGEDLLFVLEYLCHITGKIKLLDIPLYYYRVTNTPSLSKSAPKKEETEFFYESLRHYMQILGATDKQSMQIFSGIILSDFEKLILKILDDKDLSLKTKFVLIREIFNTKAYLNCCKHGIISTNRFYQWLLSNRKVFLLLIFFYAKRR